jgi:hypothetical protein
VTTPRTDRLSLIGTIPGCAGPQAVHRAKSGLVRCLTGGLRSIRGSFRSAQVRNAPPNPV